MQPFIYTDQHLRRLIEGARDIIYACDAGGRFTFANPVAAELMGYSESEILGRHFLTLIRDDYRDQATTFYGRQFVERRLDTYFEFPAVTKTGSAIWIGQHVQLILDGGDIVGFQAIARDITKQKDAEEGLRQSEAAYRSLIQGASYGIYRASAAGQFLDVNPAFAGMLGYDSPADVLALKDTSAIYADPATRAALVEECLRDGRIDGIEVGWNRRDGTRLMARLSARAVRNAVGEPTEFEVIVEDVTERRLLEERLRHGQKIEAVGQLAAGVAHNFNNLLTTVLGYAELLSASRELSEGMRSDLGEIQKAGQRAAVLTRQLLAFSVKQTPKPKDLDLNETVLEIRGMLTRLVRDNITLTCEPADRPAMIRADPGELEQVIVNLVLNARDALPRGGTIRIEVAHVSDRARAADGESVRLRVIDNGTGMALETRERIFEPFFTTKQQGEGTGLGLAAVYGIVRQHHGSISVDSDLGRGSTFTIHFPAATAALAAALEQPVTIAAANSRSRGETILLVEDEDGVRDLTRRVLEREGYRVLATGFPRDACALFEEHGAGIDLLLTDVVMPEMDGTALAQGFVSAQPGLRVLFMSGYSDFASLATMNTDRVRFIGKPFQAAALAFAVRQLLENPHEAT